MLMAKSENGWELHTISNGKLSCEKFNLDATTTEIERVKSSIRQKFGEIIDEEGILVSWDNWSGIFIMQMPDMNTASSDALIKEIYEFLVETNLN